MTLEISGQPVPVPAGWTIEPGQEQTLLVNGTQEKGYTFNLNYSLKGITTSVFVPYSAMSSLPAVSQLFAQRIGQFQGVLGLAAGS